MRPNHLIISITNQKECVTGKSTAFINPAAELDIEGYKMLLIDFDPQANATKAFINNEDEILIHLWKRRTK